MSGTPVSSRLHISIFGRRNAGKSSIINALTGQNAALVSDVAGTTTDPVKKTMELLPIGPVVITDTAGIDDIGDLGRLRVDKTFKVLNETDLAVLVIDGQSGVSDFDIDILKRIREKSIPVVGVLNKSDLALADDKTLKDFSDKLGLKLVSVSAHDKNGIDDLKRAIINAAPKDRAETSLMSGLIKPGELAVLVVPIDKAAPKGRLILPQQRVIREILDNDATAVVTKENSLKDTLGGLNKKPAIVITDSQVFKKVAELTPSEIPLTSFSILMAREKGDLAALAAGAKAIDMLLPGDYVLIAEACTHHRQTDDIATVKIPGWLVKHVGGELNFEYASGGDFPSDINKYKLIVHCGGCMINRKEMLYRIGAAKAKGVPIVNYGVLIAHVHGILQRATDSFPEAKSAFSQND